MSMIAQPVPEAPEPAVATDSIMETVPEPAVGITADFGAPTGETVDAPEEDVFAAAEPGDAPLYRVIPEPAFTLDDLTPAMREAVNNNLDTARTLYIRNPDSFGEYVDRHMLKKMAALPEEPKEELLSVGGGGASSETVGGMEPFSPESAGMTEANFRYWMERDKEFVKRRAEERDILAKSGAEGYATKKLTEGELRRADARVIAEAEAIVLGKYTDGMEGAIGRAEYDLRAGIGNAAAFGIGGAEGVTRALADFIEGSGVIGNPLGEYAAALREHSASLRGKKLDLEAEMAGPEIDTGSPVLDFLRSAVFRGTPMMAAAAGVAMIPGVGTGGAAAIMATGMGADTYGTLRGDGIEPGIALAAGAATGAASYFSTLFQLGNLTKYFRGKSPMGLFSAGTLRDIAAEAGQEAAENTAQTASEGLARLIGDPAYTSRKFWNDMKTGFLRSLDEGAAVGVTTGAMRLFGFPLAARNQMRAASFARASARVGASIAKTTMFKESPEALAGHLTGIAKAHGDGNVYAAIERLNQAGVTREKAVAPVSEGGLGLSPEAYDEAAVAGGVVAAPYGSAIVFGEKEAEAGNAAARGAFMVSPEALSVGDIARQRADAEAVVTQAEAYYAEEAAGGSAKTPLRIQAFRQGLRAAGFDAYQAAAVTAVYRAGAERSAELAGETVEAWLERRNVRLEFEKSLAGLANGSAARYENLLRKIDAAEEEAASSAAAEATDALMETASQEAAEEEEVVREIAQEALAEMDEAPGGPWSGAQNAQGAASNRELEDENGTDIRRTATYQPLTPSREPKIDQATGSLQSLPEVSPAGRIPPQDLNAVSIPRDDGNVKPAQGIAETRLQEEVKAFAAEVDRVAENGGIPSRPVTMLRQTPLVLQMIGADKKTGKSAGNKEMRIAPHVFKNIISEEHSITFDMLKQIPEAMTNPIMVFDSDTVSGDLVFMLELRDAKGATVVVPVALEARGRSGIEINVVKSAYAKERNGVPNNEWFMQQAGKNARYVNEEMLGRWQQESGVQFPFGLLRNAHDNTIHTEADLVKLRNEKSAGGQYAVETLYQPGALGSITFKRAKFDAAPTLTATTEGIAGIPDGAGFTGRLVEWAKSRGIVGTFGNTDTGWNNINVTPASIRSVNSHKAGQGKLAVLEVLPYLIRDGIYLETTQRNDKGVASHIFSGKVSVDGIPYIVGFSISEDQNGRRYYNHELTEMKEETPGALWSGALDTAGSATNRESTGNRADTKSPTPLREPISSIVRRHLFVNPDTEADTPIIETLYQPGALGSITFNPSSAVITLFKGANVSTVVHELNHLFLDDLARLVKAGRGGEKARAHLNALNEFTDGGLLADDEEERTAAKEKIARAWEMHLMTAEAPAPNLEEAFAVIRKYIAAAYRNVRANNPLVKPSEAVRNVFGAMLATDRQIADAADVRARGTDWTKAGGVDEGIQKRMDEINRRRDDEKRKRRDAARGAGRAARNESTLDARRRVVRGELSKYPVYRAIDLVKAHGGMDRAEAEALVGADAAAKIAVKHGAGVFNETGNASYAAARAAKAAGFVDAGAMLNAMLGAQEIGAHAERTARTDQEITDLAEDIFGDAEDEAEGTDDGPPASAADAADRSAEDDETAEEQAMREEIGLAMENEGEGAREKEDRFRSWRLDAAALKRAAEAKIAGLTLREAANLIPFRSARNKARREAFAAQGRGDRAKVTALKKRELYHLYEMRAAKKARTFRTRIAAEYGPGGLRATINLVAPETEKLRSLIESGYQGEQLRLAMSAAEHNASVEYGYARSLAEMALYAGFGESRFLTELAGDRAAAKALALPKESEELEGIVGDISDTVDEWLLNKERPAGFEDYRDFTVGQLAEIDRVMRWLIDTGRGKLAFLQEADIQNIRDLTAKSIEPMLRRTDRASNVDADNRKTTGALRNKIGKFIIGLTLPENWFMAMDGNPTLSGGAAGVNQRLLFETMHKANVRKDTLYADIVERMKPAFESFREAKRRLEKTFGGRLFAVEGVPVPEILKRGRNIETWDADMLLSIALQTGNDANLRRLLTDEDFEARFGVKVAPEEGQDMTAPRYNMTNAQLDAIAGLFTDAEWDAVQSVWDALDGMYGESDAVTFALTNRHVRKEEATPFAVRNTADGKAKTLRGGYFPLINDPRLSDRAAKLREGQSIEEYIRTGSVASVYGSAKQSVGAIKSRARNEEGVAMSTLPQILGADVIVRHVDAMTHYIAHALPLRDIDRLTRGDEWRRVYVAKFGQDRYDAIRKWIKNLAAPERGDASAGGRFAEKLRSLATVNALGLRWKTGIKQRLGAFNAAAYMGDAAGSHVTGWKYLAQGIHRMGVRGGLGFTNAAVADANAKSAFMAARDGGFDREMRAMQSKISPLSREFLGRTPREWQNMMFFWIQANDRAMAYSVWWGAYMQAKAGDAGAGIAAREGESIDDTDARTEEEAVAFADRAVRTQASSFAADLTENQRDRGIMRFLSMFMSGNVRQGSRLMQYIDAHELGDKTKTDVAMEAAREFAFPALAWVFAAAAVKYAMAEALGFGDDDEGNLLAEAAWEVVNTAVAPFPLVREIPRALQYGGLAGDVTAVKSAARAATSAFGAAEKLAEARYMLAVGEAMRAAGYAFGIPVMNPLDDFFGIRLSEALGLKKKRGER